VRRKRNVGNPKLETSQLVGVDSVTEPTPVMVWKGNVYRELL